MLLGIDSIRLSMCTLTFNIFIGLRILFIGCCSSYVNFLYEFFCRKYNMIFFSLFSFFFVYLSCTFSPVFHVQVKLVSSCFSDIYIAYCSTNNAAFLHVTYLELLTSNNSNPTFLFRRVYVDPRHWTHSNNSYRVKRYASKLCSHLRLHHLLYSHNYPFLRQCLSHLHLNIIWYAHTCSFTPRGTIILWTNCSSAT